MRIETRPILASNGFGFLLSLAKIRFDFGAMPKEVADDRIHVGQIQGVVLLDDLLRRGTLLKRRDDRIERYAGSRDSDHSVIARLETPATTG